MVHLSNGSFFKWSKPKPQYAEDKDIKGNWAGSKRQKEMAEMTFVQGPEIMPGMVPNPWSGAP